MTTLNKALPRKLLIAAALSTFFVVSIISPVSATTKRDAILNFVNGCFRAQDGYYGSLDRTPSSVTTLSSTHAALNIIGILNPPLDADTYDHEYDINIFLTGIANTTTGGYRNSKDGIERVEGTFYALSIARSLGINISSHMNKHAKFLLDSRNPNGGFGSSPETNSSPSIINTYYAMKALDIAGNISQVNKSLVRDYVLSCRKGGTMFAGTSNSTDVSIITTYYAVRLYKDFLTSYPDLDGTYLNMRAFIAGRLGASGGFSDPVVGSEPLLSTTYYAVALCRDIGVSIPGGDELTRQWILGKQDHNGGFVEGEPPIATASVLATSHAVGALFRISSSLAELDVDTPWTLSQIAGAVAAVLILVGIVVLVIVAYYVHKRNRI